VLAVVVAAAALLPHLYQAALPRRRPGSRRRRVLPGTTSPRDGCGYEDVERTRWRRPPRERRDPEERGFSKRRE